MSKQEAKAKVSKELAEYRAAMDKQPGATVYRRAPEIMFTEAAADRLRHLCDDEDMAALVLAGGTLSGCVKAIVDYCRKDIGNSGEISEADFRAAIRDYYRMPGKSLAGKAKAPPVPKAAAKEPTMLSTQLDMFGALEATGGIRIEVKPDGSAETSGNPSSELTDAVKDLFEKLNEEGEEEANT